MSITELCNESLQKVGTRSSIASISEDSNEARQCLIAFETIRLRLIRSAPWGFCKAVSQLAVLKALPGTPENTAALASTWQSSYPPPGWLYSYAKPSDCLRMRYVLGNEASGGNPSVPIFSYNGVQYVSLMAAPARFALGIDGVGVNQVAVINTNAQNALAIYNADVADDDLWEGDFRDAFTYALGSALALALTSDRGLAKDLITLTNMKIVEARVADANEMLTTYDTQSTSIRSRQEIFYSSFGDQFPVP